MPLHKHVSIRDELLDSVYAGKDLLTPSCRPTSSPPPRCGRRRLPGHLRRIPAGRQRPPDLATFCQTWEEDEIHKLMDLSINKNMIDKDEIPRRPRSSARCVRRRATCGTPPKAAKPVGCSAIGSSEACMLGGMAAKWRWRASGRRRANPRTSPTWCAARSRWSGTSSPSTGTSRCVWPWTSSPPGLHHPSGVLDHHSLLRNRDYTPRARLSQGHPTVDEVRRR